MASNKTIADHYQHGNLLETIKAGLSKSDKNIDNVTVEDLGPVDEFHIGGRAATERLMDQLDLTKSDHVLDVGCGLGGAARFVAQKYNCQVTGIDLAQEYIDTGNELTRWVDLEDKINLVQGSATELPFKDNSFSGAYMLHVGMNIESKYELFKEVYRVLKPGASFGIYDIMRDQEGKLTFPVPWAASSETNFLDTPDEHNKLLKEVGFDIAQTTNRRDFALDFFKQVQAKKKANGGPPPLGLHTLMATNAPEKIQNVVKNIDTGLIAPIEIIAQK